MLSSSGHNFIFPPGGNSHYVYFRDKENIEYLSMLSEARQLESRGRIQAKLFGSSETDHHTINKIKTKVSTLQWQQHFLLIMCDIL